MGKRKENEREKVDGGIPRKNRRLKRNLLMKMINHIYQGRHHEKRNPVLLKRKRKGKDQSLETAVVVLEKETARAEMIEQAARKIETEIRTEETLLEEMIETGKVALEVRETIEMKEEAAPEVVETTEKGALEVRETTKMKGEVVLEVEEMRERRREAVLVEMIEVGEMRTCGGMTNMTRLIPPIEVVIEDVMEAVGIETETVAQVVMIVMMTIDIKKDNESKVILGKTLKKIIF